MPSLTLRKDGIEIPEPILGIASCSRALSRRQSCWCELISVYGAKFTEGFPCSIPVAARQRHAVHDGLRWIRACPESAPPQVSILPFLCYNGPTA
jgi:hypothetical protein